MAVTLSCRDSTGPAVVDRILVEPFARTLMVGPSGGQTVQLAAVAIDARGNVLPGIAFTWSTSSASASVSATGLVTAVQPGTVIVGAQAGEVNGEAIVTVVNVPAASLVLSEESVALEIGPLGAGIHQFTVALRDSTGALLIGRPLNWSTNAAAVALVSGTGRVTATGAGTARIIAGREGRADTAWVTVTATDTLPDDANVSILDAQWTQGVQEANGAIPLIRGGRAGALNVLLTATRSIATPSMLTLRLREANGTIAWSSSLNVLVQTGPDPTMAIPSAQFLVPNAQLQPGRSWEVVRDPDGVLADSSLADDLFPRSGAATLALVDVPPLRLRFIPVTLSAHGNVTGDVSVANLDEYLRVVRQLHPHGVIVASVGTAFVSGQSFGTAPTGGGSAFWMGLLNEIDAARVADAGSADEHWIGVVRPPNGFTFSTFGGFAYIPGNGQSIGPFTRTATMVNVGWFSRESQSRELVAHELGHNFGRSHAPCGGAAGPDPSYPRPDGTIGPGGHNVAAWADGSATSALALPEGLGDIMGYCSPLWASRYTYRAVLEFRGYGAAAALRAPPARTRVLQVRGNTDGTRVILDAPLTLVAPPTSDDPSGEYVVEGLAADGTTLFTQRVSLGRYDHEARLRPFAAYVPLDAAVDARLSAIRVRGPAGVARRPR